MEAELLLGALHDAGAEAHWTRARQPSLPLRAAVRLGFAGLIRRRAALNIFLERYHPAWLSTAPRNVLIPNQEFHPHHAPRTLPDMDEVWCKTHHAHALYGAIRPAVQYLGFTARDRWGGAPAAAHPIAALHVAGRSWLRGTSALLEAWRRHPEWPVLTVLYRPTTLGEPVTLATGPNIDLRSEHVSESELLRLQQTPPLSILPSEVEGYGHALAEGMSAGAVVLTTDAPPMNELVTPERGALVDWERQSPMQLGTRYFVSPEQLEARITEVLCWSPEQRVAAGQAARAWFEDNRRQFLTRLGRQLQETLAQGPRATT